MSAIHPGDLIAAIATPAGAGGIAIVRASGLNAKQLMDAAFRRRSGAPVQSPGRLYLGAVVDRDEAVIDEALAVWFRAPKSYTCEDVVEFHCHGGRISSQRVLNRLMELGARLAHPGEFTRRAFLNGRLDLSEAEAVMALIGAGSQAAARAAASQLNGSVSRRVGQLIDWITGLMASIAAATDFPEEIDEAESAQSVLAGIERAMDELRRAADPRAARLIRDGLQVALIGRPNTGKSSLLNALLRADRAIVSDMPGTTRDTLREVVELDGLRLTLIDTAGQRESEDRIEQLGVERARAAQAEADCIVLVLDGSQDLTAEDARLIKARDERTLIAINKADLPRALTLDALDPPPLPVSAVTGYGLDALVAALLARAALPGADEGALVLERHIDCARAAAESLHLAREAILAGHPLDLAAVDLEAALQSLLSITGASASEAVIDRVFSAFCVGK